LAAPLGPGARTADERLGSRPRRPRRAARLRARARAVDSAVVLRAQGGGAGRGRPPVGPGRRPDRRRGDRRTAPVRSGFLPGVRPELAAVAAVAHRRRLPHGRLPHLRRGGSEEPRPVAGYSWAVGKAADWLREERRKVLGDWAAVCLQCGAAQRWFEQFEAELPERC